MPLDAAVQWSHATRFRQLTESTRISRLHDFSFLFSHFSAVPEHKCINTVYIHTYLGVE